MPSRRVSHTAVFACLAATTAALTAAPALTAVPALAAVSRVQLDHVQRSRKLFAQIADGWTTRADPNGDTYYYNEQTGQSQWEPPPSAQQGTGAPVLWRVVPAAGVYTEYTVRRGEQQVLGHKDLVDQHKTSVSEAQCIVEVADDGSAKLVTLGNRPTGLRARYGAPSYGLRRDGPPHVLVDGEEIILDVDNPESACYIIQAERTDTSMQQGGYPQQGGAQVAGWSTRFDEASGDTYYYNDATGQSQWEPPQTV